MLMKNIYRFSDRAARMALLLFAGFALACSDDKTDDEPAAGGGDNPQVAVTAIVLSEPSLRLDIGTQQTLTATLTPDDATDKSVVWSSDRPEVAAVDEQGTVTAAGVGSATITATAKGGKELSATCSVTVDPVVYVAGSYNGNTAVLWTNGVQSDLTDGGIAAIANDVYVSDKGDVYVVGWDTPDDTGIDRAVLWKNGEMSYLSDGKKNTQAKSVFVHGGDVYVAGNEIGTANKVFLWKNGEPTVLPSQANYAEVGSMAVAENGDIYVAGFDNGPTVWKNGVKTGENLGDEATQLLGICLHGSDVYYAGYRTDAESMYRAMVWKGTQVTELTDGSDDCLANAVWVSDAGDVYVAGNQSSSPKQALLWKNGTPVTLPAGSYKAFDVSGCGEDLYVVGQISTGSFPFGAQKAVLWKNGEQQPLCEEKSDARAVFVRVK